jgi:lysophospholipase L1-like esterase
MNVNPNASVVLCYGDSNTFGQRADVKGGRWPADIRWTGVLQRELGDDYYVIEEGLPSRATDLEYSKKPGRNGKVYLSPCLGSHNPVDMVLLMLGTNDLKSAYKRSVDDIAQAVAGLVADIRQYGKNKQGDAPKIVVISPIHINDKAPNYYASSTPHYDAISADKSLQLANAFKSVADSLGCDFADAAEVAVPGEDGIHFDKDSHTLFAKLLVQRIKTSD